MKDPFAILLIVSMVLHGAMLAMTSGPSPRVETSVAPIELEIVFETEAVPDKAQPPPPPPPPLEPVPPPVREPEPAGPIHRTEVLVEPDVVNVPEKEHLDQKEIPEPEPAPTAALLTDTLPTPDSRNIPPIYPAAARRAHRQGTVILAVDVASDGRALRVRIDTPSGYAALDNEALRAVRRWRFTPATKNGEAVAFTVMVPIRFVLAP